MKRFFFADLQTMASNEGVQILFSGLTGRLEDVRGWNPACLPIMNPQFEFENQTKNGGVRYYKYIG